MSKTDFGGNEIREDNEKSASQQTHTPRMGTYIMHIPCFSFLHLQKIPLDAGNDPIPTYQRTNGIILGQKQIMTLNFAGMPGRCKLGHSFLSNLIRFNVNRSNRMMEKHYGYDYFSDTCLHQASHSILSVFAMNHPLGLIHQTVRTSCDRTYVPGTFSSPTPYQNDF